MTAETDESSREAWVASLDAVAALEPEIAVAGHKRADTPDLPENIAASQQYLREVQPHCQRDTIADIVSALLDCTATGTTHASYGTPPAQLPKARLTLTVIVRFVGCAIGVGDLAHATWRARTVRAGSCGRPASWLI